MFRSCMSRAICATAAILLFVSTAEAGWEVTNLHPDGMDVSRAYATTGTEHGGEAGVTSGVWTREHAGIWTGPALSWVDMHPGIPDTWSAVYGMAGAQQVGYYGTTGLGQADARAALWTGSSASYVDLNPAGYDTSKANATSGTYQAGYATVGDARHAGFWRGTADTFYDLHLGDALQSSVEGTTGLVHAGWTSFGDGSRAGIWRPTLDGWLWFDRHEITGRTYSRLLDTTGGQHVGAAWDSVGDSFAGLWSEVGPTFTNLHPSWGPESHARALSQNFQVGDAFVGTAIPHACLWQGTSSSAWDLHGLLGDGYVTSSARDIHQSGGELWIVGGASSNVTGREEAVLWHYTPPAPDPNAKCSQMPDPYGMDVSFGGTEPYTLADDWQCTQSGAVNGIRFWVSSRHDDEFTISAITAAIYRDAGGRPGDELWSGEFVRGEFSVGDVEIGLLDWYDPSTGDCITDDHVEFYPVLMDDIADPFTQTEGDVYWLGLEVQAGGEVEVGWTSALLADPPEPDGELDVDLAFEIIAVPEPAGVLLVGTGVLAAFGCLRRPRKRS